MNFFTQTGKKKKQVSFLCFFSDGITRLDISGMKWNVTISEKMEESTKMLFPY